MKLGSFLILNLAVVAVATAGELDGKTFCRTIRTDGSFGQPVGDRDHCVSFEKDVMTDNSSTFFGNPPERMAYQMAGNQIMVMRDGRLQFDSANDYTANKERTQIGIGSLILNLKQ